MSEAWTSEAAEVAGTYFVRRGGRTDRVRMEAGRRAGREEERSLYPIPSAETVAAAVEVLSDCESITGGEPRKRILAVLAALRGSPAAESGSLEKGKETER